MSDAAKIERIVQAVLDRLAPAPVAPAPPPVSGAALTLASLVVTRKDVEGRLDGVQSLALAPRAVVTPSARDYLRERGVTLVRAAGAATPAAGRVSLSLGVAETACNPAALLEALASQGVEIEQLARTGLANVVFELADQAALGGRSALLLTDDSPAALVLANRRRGVRAVAAGDPLAVGRAIASIGCNFLVVEPAGRGLFQLRQIVLAFVRGGPRACPAAYRQRLD